MNVQMRANLLPFATFLSLAALGEKASYDAGKSFAELCMENGFQSELYQVKTSDGYVLTLYRIPGYFTEMQEEPKSSKPAVLFLHAWNGNFLEYLENDADKANAFILASQGYDVWLGNNRGSNFSQGHVSLTIADREYWDYWQGDLGLKDVPAFIDHILAQTGLPNLSYIGHSQGTTQFILGASLNPTYFKEKVNAFIALAPVANTANITQLELVMAAHNIENMVDELVEKKGFYNWFPPLHRFSEAMDGFCAMAGDLCEKFGGMLMDESIDNVSRLPEVFEVFPTGASYRCFAYYAQAINTGKFTLYDYGPQKNSDVYGTEWAPLVPLENYPDIPTVLLSGDVDKLSTPADVAWLSKQLGDKVVFQKEYHLDHGGFVLANDMSFFSVDALEQLKKYNPTVGEKDLITDYP